jgi:hypothetical protein
MTAEDQMQRRMRFFLSAILIMFFGLMSLSDSRAVADDCLASPNAASPQGTHWYYRVDRTTHRQCWYLGAEGTKVRVQTRQANAPARPRSPKPSEPAVSTASAQVTSSDTAPDEVLPKRDPAEAASPAKAAADDPGSAAFSRRWADAPKAAIPVDTATSGMRSSYAQEQSTPNSEDEMPLVWPILTPEELAAADQPKESAFAHLAGVFAAVMGIAALIGILLLRISTGRRPRRPAVAHAASLHSSARTHRPASHEMSRENESPLAPSAHSSSWPGAPEDEDEYPVPELLAQLRRQTHRHYLDDAMLAPAR